jgi:hypothetical protein
MLMKTLSDMVVHTCNLSYTGVIGKKIMVWSPPQTKTRNAIWKMTKAKWAESVAQVGEHLPS